jgi:predicted nucleotide-binding protein (sugar kinase/HSP70/actin superfamily)
MDIGGECVWVIGEYIDRANAGFSGLVHSYPFTCMPEVTARTIITNKLRKEYDLPVIFFSFDEQSGQEGFRTRLEAFTDLMLVRREHKLKKEELKLEDWNKKVHDNIGNKFFHECLDIVETS